MDYDTDDLYDEPIHRRAKTQPKTTHAAKNRKASYEGNADVQRWLRELAVPEGGKPPFDPTFLANQRDRPWVLSSLTHFYEDDLITDVLAVANSGKEATVYCCSAHPSISAEYLAAKIYRPRMFRSLSNDAIYRHSRVQRDESGQALRSGRRQMGTHSEKGRAAQVTAWIANEYAVQAQLYAGGVAVPQPRAQIGNAVLMDYIGDVNEPAPRLKDVALESAEARPLFDAIIHNIALCLKQHVIHGDLSAYNILYWAGVVWLIDFAQAVDPRYNPDVFPLLARDVERVCHYFARYGVTANAYQIAAEMWARYG